MPAPKGNDFAVGNSGGGAPEGNTNALKNDGGPPEGNTNALIHGRTMDRVDLRETFTSEGRTIHAHRTREVRERGPEWSEEWAMEYADASVMFDRLSVELIESRMRRTVKIPGGGGTYERFDARKMDAHMAYHRDLCELEDKAAEERERQREQQTRRYVEILAGLPSGGFDDLVHDREPPSEESESEDPTTDIEREIAYESLTPNPNTTLAQTALADGSGNPEDRSADSEDSADGEDETEESSKESVDRILNRYTSADMVR